MVPGTGNGVCRNTPPSGGKERLTTMELLRNAMIGILVVGLTCAGFVGCGDDDGEEHENGDQAPMLPPDASMALDLTVFNGAKLAPGSLAPGKNFSNAAFRVGVLNVVVVVLLAPPAIVFKAATTAIPARQDDGTWLWTYEVNAAGQEYAANLTGSLEGGKALWSMEVTNSLLTPPLNDFEWYTGESELDNSAGSWRFFDFLTPQEAKHVGTIEWSVQSEGKSELLFSNTNIGGPSFGDTVLYSVQGTTALISVYSAATKVTAEITWDLITGAGSMKVPGYNNGERAFWDADKQDAAE